MDGIITSMSGQMLLFLSSACAGAAIGVLYDLFRILRRTAKHPSLLIQIEDLLFWLAGTALMFYFLLIASGGVLRIYMLLGAGLGDVLYFATLSRLIVKLAVLLINFLKKLLLLIFKTLRAPLLLVYRLLRKPLQKLRRILRKKKCAVHTFFKAKRKAAAQNWRILRKKI